MSLNAFYVHNDFRNHRVLPRLLEWLEYEASLQFSFVLFNNPPKTYSEGPPDPNQPITCEEVVFTRRQMRWQDDQWVWIAEDQNKRQIWSSKVHQGTPLEMPKYTPSPLYPPPVIINLR